MTINFEDYEKYDAFVLDMDGTLIDSGPLHEKAWTLTAEHYGIPVEPKLMRSLAGVPIRETVAKLIAHFDLKIDASPAEVQQYKDQQVHKYLLEFIQPTALAELVKHFYGKKPMAVGTGAQTSSAHTLLKACGLDGYMDFVVGADQVRAFKPAPDTFLLCAELMKVEPKNCIVFEDAPLGLEAADRAGMAKVDVQTELGIVNQYFL